MSVNLDDASNSGDLNNFNSMAEAANQFRNELNQLIADVSKATTAVLSEDIKTVDVCNHTARNILSSTQLHTDFEIDNTFYFPGERIALSMKVTRKQSDNSLSMNESVYSLDSYSPIKGNDSAVENIKVPEELAKRVKDLFERKQKIIQDYPTINRNNLSMMVTRALNANTTNDNFVFGKPIETSFKKHKGDR